MCGRDKKNSEKEKITIAAIEAFLPKIEQALIKYIEAKQSGSCAEESDADRDLNMLLNRIIAKIYFDSIRKSNVVWRILKKYLQKKPLSVPNRH